MVTRDILNSAVRDEDGNYWLVTTPERYHRDIEPGANRVFATAEGQPLPGDKEVAVVLNAAGEFIRWGEPSEFDARFS